MVWLSKTYFNISKFKVYIIVDTIAKNLEIVIYIILKKISKARIFSIIGNFFNIAVVTFVCTILIIKLDIIRFWLCYLLN